MRHRFILLLLIAISMQTIVGCKSFDLMKNDTDATSDDDPWWKKDDLPPVGKPAKIVAIWSNSVFNEPGSGPMRGLGGRVYFYNAKHQPVRVEGELTAYLYDDTGEIDQENQKADKRIKFSEDEVAEKYTPTEFGPSYSFWLPWDNVGGELAQLSVIPVFKSSTGDMLVGDQARYVLPGKKPANQEQKRISQGKILPASYEDEAFSPNTLQLKSSRIRVPPSMQERLRRPLASRKEDPRSVRRSKLRSRQAAESIPAEQDTQPSQVRSVGNQKLTAVGTFGRRPGIVRVDEVSRPVVNEANATASTPPPTADSPLDPHQAQTLRSSQQAFARDPTLLDRAKSLFDRSR